MLKKLATSIVLAAALVLGFTAPAQAVYYDGGVLRFYGGNANIMTNNEAAFMAVAALQRQHYWVNGSSVKVVARPDFRRAYVRAYLPLPDCLYLRRDPWNANTNHNTSTFVGIWGYTGKSCGAGP